MLEGARFLARAVPHLPRFASYKPGNAAGLAELLEARAARFPERPFVVFEDRRTTYREHDAAANRVARWAHGVGLRRGDVVALLMENRPEYLSTWMGLAKLGVVTALVNTNLTGRALRHALAVSGAHHLVLGSECAEAFATTADDLERPLQVVVDHDPAEPAPAARASDWGPDLGPALAAQPSEAPPAFWREGFRAGDVLLYIYTSGTTGPPKAARFSHLRFLATADLAAWAQGLGPDDVHYCVLPLYHSAGGVMQLGATLFAGATLALRRRFSARAFWDDARKHEATAFQYIGELCRYLVTQPERPGDRDHRVRVAIGNGLRPDVWEVFQRRFAIPRILEFYGATEGNVGLMNFENEPGSVGRVPSRLVARLMSNAKLVRYDVERDVHPRGPDGFCVECADDEPGELLGRIPPGDPTSGRFEGYTSDEATERKILRDVFARGDAWFRTGDLLRRDRRGFHYFVDRVGDTYRWKGENVSTQEVAEACSGFSGLGMVNVYGVEVPGAEGRAGMLAFVPEKGFTFDPGAFHAFVRERLPAYAAPVFVRQLEVPDLTGTFKLRKVSLQADGFDPARVADPLWVRDDDAGTYAPLTAETFAAIREGGRRL
jgi:fatty-acyl-CoA synthase